MDQQQFVESLYAKCMRVGAGVIQELDKGVPGAGRQQSDLSQRYRSLPHEAQGMVKSAVTYAIYSIVFSLLCELDGVGDEVVGTPEGGMYQLRYVAGGTSVLLNSPAIDDSLDELHDMFCDQYEENYE